MPFKITKDGETLSQGQFITLEDYEQYKNSVPNESGVDIIGEETEYIFYSYNDKEYNYVIKIEGTETGLVLDNNVSKSSAIECFEILKITEE